MQSRISYAGVTSEKYNDNLAQYFSINTGKILYDNIYKTNNKKPIIAVDAQIENIANISLLALEDSIVFNSVDIAVPEDNEVVVTAFISSSLNDQKKGTLSIPGYTQLENVTIKSIDDEVDEGIVYDYNLNKTSNYEKDVINNNYKCAFISKNFLLNIYRSSTEFIGMIPSLFSNRSDQFIDRQTSVKYQKMQSEAVLYGSKPQNKKEVAVTQSYFDRYLKSVDETLTDYGSVVGRKLYFKDYNTSPNRVMHEDKLNLFDIDEEVTIVGVVRNSPTAEELILVEDNYFEEYISLQYFYGSQIKVDATDPESIKKLYANNLIISTDCSKLIVGLKGFLSTSVNIILIILEIIFLLISLILLSLSCSINVKEKYREICIFKSLGIDNRSINSVFIMLNSAIVMLSFLLGVVLSFVSVWGINRILMSESVMNLNFNLLFLNYYGLLIIFPVCLTVALITTIYPLIVIKRIDLAVALKG